LTITHEKKIELAHRRHGGLEVALLWQPDENTVSVAVEDERTGEAFEIEVPGDKAMEAFEHPYAFAREAA
jgi:hypothetical protein